MAVPIAAMDAPSKSYFAQALDALRAGDRPRAAERLRQQLDVGATSLKNLPSVGQLAAQIGEVDLVIEAARQAIEPGSLKSAIGFWSALSVHGRSDEALEAIRQQPEFVQRHPFVLHLRGTMAVQVGRSDEAEPLFRETLEQLPTSVDTWLALSQIKTFDAADPDILSMEKLRHSPVVSGMHRASLLYALGKAMEDIGEVDRAFAYYQNGADIRRSAAPFDAAGFSAAADRAISDFTADSLSRLKPSGFRGQRSLFVTGLPRSGTTLTEQILRSHSAVADGAECNLYGSALISSRGQMGHALAYQQNSSSNDPWGDVARDYADLTDRLFRTDRLIVDKSLGQSVITGLMLHSAPDLRIACLRRNPEDVALSCFRTAFTTGLQWTWSLTDIAEVMRAEDRLFEHWTQLFPDRILVVPYEDLAASPADWAIGLQRHFGLETEEGLETVSRQGRAVRTASAGQIRGSITTARIGRSATFSRHLAAFRDRYYS